MFIVMSFLKYASYFILCTKKLNKIERFKKRKKTIPQLM